MLQANSTAVVLLGASEFPDVDALEDSEVFRRSASDFLELCCDSRLFGVPATRVLNLFNSDRDAPSQLVSFAQHVAAWPECSTVIIYYCGHGVFNENRDYCLAVRRTNDAAKDASLLTMKHLSKTIRRFQKEKLFLVIIDACYSGAAITGFVSQGDARQASIVALKAIDEGLPEQSVSISEADYPGLPKLTGVVLMSAAPSSQEALAPEHAVHTMFTGALLTSLRRGDPKSSSRLSLDWLVKSIKSEIFGMYPEEAVSPQIHLPTQSFSNIQDLDILPNLAIANIGSGEFPGPASEEIGALRETVSSLEERLANFEDTLPSEIVKLLDSRLGDIAGILPKIKSGAVREGLIVPVGVGRMYFLWIFALTMWWFLVEFGVFYANFSDASGFDILIGRLREGFGLNLGLITFFLNFALFHSAVCATSWFSFSMSKSDKIPLDSPARGLAQILRIILPEGASLCAGRS